MKKRMIFLLSLGLVVSCTLMNTEIRTGSLSYVQASDQADGIIIEEISPDDPDTVGENQVNGDMADDIQTVDGLELLPWSDDVGAGQSKEAELSDIELSIRDRSIPVAKEKIAVICEDIYSFPEIYDDLYVAFFHPEVKGAYSLYSGLAIDPDDLLVFEYDTESRSVKNRMDAGRICVEPDDSFRISMAKDSAYVIVIEHAQQYPEIGLCISQEAAAAEADPDGIVIDQIEEMSPDTEDASEAETESENESETAGESMTESEYRTEQPEEPDRETELQDESLPESESETEAAEEHEPESESETEAADGHEPESESETEAADGHEPEFGNGTTDLAEAETEPESETADLAEAETEPESETTDLAEPESEPESETDVSTESETESESGTTDLAEAETEPESETDASAESETESESETEPETESTVRLSDAELLFVEGIESVPAAMLPYLEEQELLQIRMIYSDGSEQILSGGTDSYGNTCEITYEDASGNDDSLIRTYHLTVIPAEDDREESVLPVEQTETMVFHQHIGEEIENIEAEGKTSVRVQGKKNWLLVKSVPRVTGEYAMQSFGRSVKELYYLADDEAQAVKAEDTFELEKDVTYTFLLKLE